MVRFTHPTDYMTKVQYLVFAACGLALSTSGCAVPYFASVRGPVRSVRVLDAETAADIPEATVSLQSQTSARFLGPPPCTLACPDLCELRAGASRGRLLRNADRSFHMSGGLGMGSRGYFTGRPEDPNEYPRGVVIVAAPGYRPAMLRYTVGPILPGWSCVETLDSADAASASHDTLKKDAGDAFQGNRCELGDDGVLRFHLRSLKPESPAASPIKPPGTAARIGDSSVDSADSR